MKKFIVFLSVILVLALGLGGYYLYLCSANEKSLAELNDYIQTFEPVNYKEDRLVPEFYEGHYSYMSDRDIKIMFLTDLHIGGGKWTAEADKKTVYEVITMLQAQKPDLVILGGDNIYTAPGPIYHGGFTRKNDEVTKTVISIFEHEQVYYTTVFGNHETEFYSNADRKAIGDLYADTNNQYSIFKPEFVMDEDNFQSVSNQCIVLYNTKEDISKVLLLMDTNSYADNSIISTVKNEYDTIRQQQVEWAKETISSLSDVEGKYDSYKKCIMFGHIPIGEYKTAFDELFVTNTNEKGKVTGYSQLADKGENTTFIQGFWDDKKICYGGNGFSGISPATNDNFFEVMSLDLDSLQACICGHDHLNAGMVEYRDVILAYGYSMDNTAYGKEIAQSGMQRGATIVKISQNGSIGWEYNNAYTDYGCDPNKYVPVYLDHPMYPEYYCTIEKQKR